MRTASSLLAFAFIGVSTMVGCSLLTSLDDLHATDGGKSPGMDSSGPDTSDVSPRPPDGPCMSESDAAFCARLGKSCESVTANDNCGVSRTVNICGVCMGAASACIDNVCTAPLCSGDYSGKGVVLPALNVNGTQAALFGVSGNGGSVLFLRAASSCLGNTTPLYIADATTVNLPTPPNYALAAIGAFPALQGMLRQQQSMTLSSDGLTIIGVSTNNQMFLESKRSAVGAVDFGVAAAGAFNTINASVPQAGFLTLPAISGDGLAFYYTVVNAQNTMLNGVYEATRLQTSVPFNAGVMMPAIIQNYSGVTGVSADRMTLFVSQGFSTTILARTSLSQPYAVSTIIPPSAAFRVEPIATCGFLFGTCEPGGCANEQICLWAKH